jgi:prepilin-type N-terminal cleavage/methylation domain-containing protein
MKFFNQRGMTLTEVLIAASLMGGVALVTAKLMGEQANSQAYLKTMASIASTMSMVENNIQNPVSCKGMFAGKPLNASSAFPLGTPALDVDVLSFVTPTGVTKGILGENEYADFSIGNNAIKLVQSPIGTSIADLKITFTPKNKTSLFSNKQSITKKISFVVSKNASTGLIVSCGAVLGDSNLSARQTFCSSLGGAAVWNGTKCTLLSVKCPYGQIGTKLTSLGGIICEDLASQVNLNELFDTTPVNCVTKPNLRIINSGNKFKLDCY